MGIERIGRVQFYLLLLLYLIGGVIALGTGTAAMKDVWLAVLLGLVPGLAIYAVYSKLFRMYPHVPMTVYFERIVGPYAGKALAFLYSVHFMYQSSRNLRGCGNLLVISVYDATPLFALITAMGIAMIYILSKGLGVLTRTAAVFLLVLLGMGLMGNVFLWFSNTVEVTHLLPVLEKGWRPVVNTLPDTYFLPFAELVVVGMLFPYVRPGGHPGKVVYTGAAAAVTAGLLLSYTMALNVSVLGADQLRRTVFPLFTALSKIDIGDFIQRLDGIAVSILFISYFFKACVYGFVAMAAAAELFRWERPEKLSVPLGIIIVFSSIMLSENFTENIYEGHRLNPYVAFPFQTGIPVVLLIVAWFRSRRRTGGQAAS
ncbi:GerAB/ArcD/ProY family transporter [Gorillibacterium sp. sgz5001074]|uniref:GerAB/ArcD/ProY family transporter n=1 Tax=Gorillibacterium sp. sgz5001074 TaxID=3446695 RepID=UPI003F669462